MPTAINTMRFTTAVVMVMVVVVVIFFMCEDFLRILDNSLPTCAFFFLLLLLFEVEIRLRTLIQPLRL